MTRVRRITAVGPITQCRLEQNEPNPFHKQTTIRFVIAKTCDVRLAIHDREHETIRLFVNGTMRTGKYAVVWDGKAADGQRAPNGFYTYQLEANGFVASRKLEIAKRLAAVHPQDDAL